MGKVAGCEVSDGMMKKGSTVRILRGSEIVFKGALKTLRNVKSDVQEMNAGQVCKKRMVMMTRRWKKEEGKVVMILTTSSTYLLTGMWYVLLWFRGFPRR